MFLYHYTDAAGFAGMCTSRKLWFTHIRHLNDPSEGNYFEAAVANYIAERVAGQTREKRETLERIDAAAKYGFVGEPGASTDDYPYVFCLSEDDDSQVQWVTYAGMSGFALGFSVDAYVRFVADTTDNALRVETVKVIYEPDEQRIRLEEVVDELLQHGGDHMDLYRALDPLRLSFKDKNFRQEREWRLVVRGAQNTEVYRERKERLVPYVELPWENRTHSDYTTINDVVVGPLVELDATRLVIRRMLNFSNSWKDQVYQVRKSSLPFKR